MKRNFYFLKKTSDYKLISKKGQTIKTKSLVALVLKKADLDNPNFIKDIPLFGITISRKIGGAVTRNLYKRRLKGMMQEISTEPKITAYTISLFCRKAITNLNYSELKKELDKILKTL